MVTRHADLVLDNARTRAPGGVRSLDADGRQLVFRHEGYQVELLLQRGRRGPVVWGRLLRSDTGAPCGDVVVERLGGHAERSRTDAFGEFCLGVEDEPVFALRVETDGEAFLCTPAADVVAACEDAAVRC